MSSSKLEDLRKYRQRILMAEVIALLHDIGKLSGQFIDQKSSSPTPSTRDFEHERAIEAISDFVDAQFLNILISLNFRNFLRFKGIESREHLGRVLDLILYHDKGKHSAFLVRLLNRCDGIDSGADKGTTRDEGLPQQAKQASDQTFISTAFGLESEVWRIDLHESDSLRLELTKRIAQELQKLVRDIGYSHRHLLEIVRDYFQKGLGETRRSANDVTLWDHSFSVATLYKTAISQLLYNDSLNIEDLRWRILRVNFDVLGLYGKAISIADLLGYQEAVRRACEKVKRLVEEEYPLGNEVYQDTTGIYFTFPDVDLPPELAEEIRRRVEEVEPELAPRIAVGKGTGNTAGEQLRTMLAEQRQKARRELVAPFEEANLSPSWQEKWENLAQGRWEICPVCRLRPKREDKEICGHCEKRRRSRIEVWLGHPAGTIWMDEIADHNGRVALIVGKFGLEGWLSGDLVRTMLVRAVEDDPEGCRSKNPSPARLRRVWETCRKFWTDTVEGKILTDHPYGRRTPSQALRNVRMFVTPDIRTDWQENFPYDGTVEGRPISLLWDKGKGHFITIMNLQLSAGEDETLDELADSWKGRKVEVRVPGFPRQVRRFRIEDAVPAPGDFGRYRPYLPLLESPDRFLCLVPAHDALDIARKVRSEYVEQMGKVQDRLPLFLGLVFFPRKMPLTAAMDAGTRMLEECVLTGETWKVECVKPTDDMKCYVRLSSEGRRLEYRVPVRMGDGTTEDIWYPYFFFEGDPGERRLRFQLDGRWLVHVCDLKEDDRVRVWPSKFSYTFLEHTARRFAFDPERDVMLLDELPRMMKMWEDICRKEDMTDTKLHAVWSLLDAKWDLWMPDGHEAFEELVNTTLKREGILGVTVEDMLAGRFQRCLELHLRILRRKVKEERDGQG